MLRLAVTGALLLAAMGAAAVLPSLLTGDSSESAAPGLNTPSSIGRTVIEASPLERSRGRQAARRPQRPAATAAIERAGTGAAPFVGAPDSTPSQEQPAGTRPEQPSEPAITRRARPRRNRPTPAPSPQRPLLPPAESPASPPAPAVEAAALPGTQDERRVLDVAPPVQQQPTEQPPAEQPPADQPPVEQPPAEPPAEKDPGWDPQPPPTASPSEPDRQAEREARREQREAEREQRQAEREAERQSKNDPQPVPYSMPDATEPEQAWQPESSDDDCDDD
jgi:hypothetical protein